ncbi:MAG: hypothetical protein M1829_005091 [Trizodia sp. TS-e1964]|nr:MAG: hypothetical protein M1829_005091 [Trizodia sp. TS-e1964]
MDPFSSEGELLTMQNAFHQGQYSVVSNFDTSSLSPENAPLAQILALRARIAAGEAKEALATLESLGKTKYSPDFLAIKALAEYTVGNKAAALKLAEDLATEHSENSTVQVLAGTVLQASGKSEEALTLLSKHEDSLEAVALIVQIHLEQNRTDLALREVQTARKWAQDSLLVNLAESWVGLRVGGEKYQQAFYVFEELAQTASTSSTRSIVGQGIAEIHLGRYPEAEAALEQALEKDPKNADLLANTIVLSLLLGKDTKQLTA